MLLTLKVSDKKELVLAKKFIVVVSKGDFIIESITATM